MQPLNHAFILAKWCLQLIRNVRCLRSKDYERAELCGLYVEQRPLLWL
jgi:hypothetical protein